MREELTISIDSLEQGGFIVESDDLPELNIFVKDEVNLDSTIAAAIQYLYRHNRKAEVRALTIDGKPCIEPPEADNG